MKIESNVCRSAIFLVIATLSSGCIGWSVESDVREELDDLRSLVVAGQTSREAVHERLGEALFSDEKVEVFRPLEGRDATIVIPAWQTQQVTVYAMVVYDENQIVRASDWDIFQDGPAEVLGGDQHNWAWRSASLEAGGYHFVSYKTESGPRREILLAPVDEPPEIVPPVGMCAVYLILPGFIPGPSALSSSVGVRMDFYLDGELLAGSQVFSRWLEVPAFVRVLLAAGEHEINATDRLMTRKLSCASGSRIYLYPKAEWRDTGEKSLFGKVRKKLVGEIVATDAPIAPLAERRRVLFYARD